MDSMAARTLGDLVTSGLTFAFCVSPDTRGAVMSARCGATGHARRRQPTAWAPSLWQSSRGNAGCWKRGPARRAVGPARAKSVIVAAGRRDEGCVPARRTP